MALLPCIDTAEVQHKNANQKSGPKMGSTKSVKLNPEVEARIESMTLDEVRAMLEWGAILDDAIELMWDVGADRSEIVQALRLAADKMDNYREEDQLLGAGL